MEKKERREGNALAPIPFAGGESLRMPFSSLLFSSLLFSSFLVFLVLSHRLQVRISFVFALICFYSFFF